MAPTTLQGTTVRVEERLDRLRDQIHSSQFSDLDSVRRFIDRYVTENPDEARSRSTSYVDELVGNLRSELGLASGTQPQLTSVISSHVRDLVLGRAQASEDTARWAVHRAATQVTMYSGQLVYETDDIFIDGAGIDFLMRRTYKSQGFHNGPLGINWDHSYNLRLRDIDGGRKVVRTSGGFQEGAYTKHALYGQGADLDYWLPPPGEHSVIFAADRLSAAGIAVPADCQDCPRVLRTADGHLHFYEDDPSFAERYRIRRIQDRDGNYLRFLYRSTGGLDGEQIWRVEVNSPERLVTFASYDEHGRLLVINDYVGRTWRFQYDDFGDLVVCTMPGGDRYTQGLTERYVYSTPTAAGELLHKLLQVYDTADRLTLENEYGSDQGLLSFGRIVRQREGNGLRAFEYEDVALATGLPAGEPELEEDMPAHQTLLVRRNGHAVHHVYNKFGNLIARDEDISDDGARRRLLARYRYNRDGALIGSITAEGRTARHLFGRDVYMHAAGHPAEEDLPQRGDLDWRTRLGFGNRLAVVQQAHTNPQAVSLSFPSPLRDLYAVATDPQDVTVKIAYEPDFQNVISVSHPAYTRSPFPGDVADGPQANPDFARTLTTFDYDRAGRITRIRYPDTTRDGAPELQGIQERFLAYDGRGRLLEYADRAGARQRLSYFPAPGQPQDPDAPKEGYLRELILDPHDPQSNPGGLNLVTSREVNLVGAVTRLTTPKGQAIDFAIDALNRVTQVTRPLASGVSYATRYTYCRNRRVERIERDLRDLSGNPLWGGVEVHVFRYDENDNAVGEERGGADEAGRLVTRNTYDDGNLHSGVTLPRGNRVCIEYGEHRLLRRIIRGAGSDEAIVNGFLHDGDGLLVEQTDGRNLRTVFAYDAFGRHVATRDYDGQGGLVRLVRQDYDKAGNLTVERLFECDGQDFRLLYHAQYIFDELNQRTETRVRRFQTPLPYAVADVAQQDDEVPLAEAVRTLYFYDQAGRLVRVERHGSRLDAAGNPAPQKTVLVTAYNYNPLGWLTAEIDPLSNRTEMCYDRHGLVTRVDVFEQVLSAPSGAGEEVFTTLYGYDELDRLTSITDGLGNTTRFEHDSRDAVISRHDPLGNVIRFEYDVHGSQVAEHIEMSDTGLGGGPCAPGSDIVTHYEYDANGNLVRLVDAHGASTEQTYDALDRRVALRHTDGATATFQYDGNDNLVQMQDGNGLVQHTTFNPLDLPIRTDVDASGLQPGLSVEAPAFEAFEYDAMRRMTRACNDWADVRLKHDSLGHTYEEAVQFSGLAGTFILRRDLDDFGFVTRLTYPVGRMLTYEPDAVNRIVRVESQAYGADYPGNLALPAQRMLLRNTYRGLRIVEKAYGNSTESAYVYDAAGRVTGISHTSPQHANLLTLQLLYDASGNLRRQHEYAAASGAYGEAYGYDSRNQLTLVKGTQAPAPPLDLGAFAPRQTRPPDPPQLTGQAQIDALLGALPQVPNAFTYRYDKLGNRLEERQPNQAPVHYVANVLNQVKARDTTTYAYDPNGNLVQENHGSVVRRYAYNHRNQLVRVMEGGTGLARYRHDALGRRVWSQDATGETFSLYDGENVVEEYRLPGPGQPPQIAAQYVNEGEIDSRYQLATGGGEFWYIKDLVSSTRALTGANGAVVARYRFSPFGTWALPGNVPASPNCYLFAGRRYERAFGSYDFRAREYAPELGRFVQRDSKRYSDTSNDIANLYEYVDNSPLTRTDPSGWQSEPQEGKTVLYNLGEGSLVRIPEKSATMIEEYRSKPGYYVTGEGLICRYGESCSVVYSREYEYEQWQRANPERVTFYKELPERAVRSKPFIELCHDIASAAAGGPEMYGFSAAAGARTIVGKPSLVRRIILAIKRGLMSREARALAEYMPKLNKVIREHAAGKLSFEAAEAEIKHLRHAAVQSGLPEAKARTLALGTHGTLGKKLAQKVPPGQAGTLGAGRRNPRP